MVARATSKRSSPIKGGTKPGKLGARPTLNTAAASRPKRVPKSSNKSAGLSTGSPNKIPFQSSRALSKESNSTSKLLSKVKNEKVETVAGEWDVLPHGLGTKFSDPLKSEEGKIREESSEKQGIVLEKLEEESLKDEDEGKIEQSKITRQKKKHPYGLTPGFSPYPNHHSPTADDCRQVNDLLASIHGVVAQPAVIPPPSSTVTGCGEVPDLLDALLRTLLSANTTSRNSAKALKGLIHTFGSVDGSPNWDLVRQATVEEVKESISSGGLADKKAKYIKGVLDLVYTQNLEFHQKAGLPVDNEQNLLSLARIFELKSNDDAMDELVKFPGIGVKTASCVILFCMRRPSFAVDTHVQRFCQWLGWVPPGGTENKTFSHLEVRVPNELKYALHQLFIKHGRTCFRCRANTNPLTPGWSESICPIEHLVTRTGKMKQPRAPVEKLKPAHKKVLSGRVGKDKSAKIKGKKGKKVDDESDESDTALDLESVVSDELSEVEFGDVEVGED